jgi:Probable N6-adenine methyltransferase
MVDQTDFDKTVDRWVSATLTQDTDWATLLYRLPGVYPAAVLESVTRLSLSHMIRFRDAGSIKTNTPFAMQLWSQRTVVTPHPQDASWWFADSALQTLVERMRKLPATEGAVLLLGTPTLFHFAKREAAQQSLLLLDKEFSEQNDGQHRAFRVDLLKEQPAYLKAEIIIADPPWYRPDMRAFLWTARRNAKPGTFIMMSVPPVGTRPGVQKEWRELLDWAERLGLTLFDYEPAALAYVSPPFERNALLAAGLNCCPMDWRRGDLAVFSCNARVESSAELALEGVYETWQEVAFRQVRLRIRTTQRNGWESPWLSEIVPGDVLPSVSRRDKRLGSVQVWTTGNRVFGCLGSLALYKIAEALETNQYPVSSLEVYWGSKLDDNQTVQVEETAERLRQIIEIEEQEIAEWQNRLNENVVELPSC